MTQPDGSSVANPTPLLMIPLRRCGSHALRLRLNFNPDFYSPYPIHLVEFMPLLPCYGDLDDDYNYFQLIVDLVGLQTATMVKWDGVALDPVQLFSALSTRPRSVHAVVWEMLFSAGRAHGARVVMDKSLESVHYAEELIAQIPGMRFLHVVRDPRAQVASLNKSIILHFDTLLNAQLWRDNHLLARQLIERHPDRVLTLRFEDFIRDQETELRRVCEFLDLTFAPEMLDVANSDEAKRISTISSLWESNASRPLSSNIDKFRRTLTPEQIDVIEAITGDLMDAYGYERLSSASSVDVDQAAIQAAHERSEVERKAAWERLRVQDPQDYQLRQFRSDYLAMLKARFERQRA